MHTHTPTRDLWFSPVEAELWRRAAAEYRATLARADHALRHVVDLIVDGRPEQDRPREGDGQIRPFFSEDGSTTHGLRWDCSSAPAQASDAIQDPDPAEPVEAS